MLNLGQIRDSYTSPEGTYLKIYITRTLDIITKDAVFILMIPFTYNPYIRQSRRNIIKNLARRGIRAWEYKKQFLMRTPVLQESARTSKIVYEKRQGLTSQISVEKNLQTYLYYLYNIKTPSLSIARKCLHWSRRSRARLITKRQCQWEILHDGVVQFMRYQHHVYM